jgi:hypothetical protein
VLDSEQALLPRQQRISKRVHPPASDFRKSLIHKRVSAWHDPCKRKVMRGDRRRADSFNKEPS